MFAKRKTVKAKLNGKNVNFSFRNVKLDAEQNQMDLLILKINLVQKKYFVSGFESKMVIVPDFPISFSFVLADQGYRQELLKCSSKVQAAVSTGPELLKRLCNPQRTSAILGSFCRAEHTRFASLLISVDSMH